VVRDSKALSMTMKAASACKRPMLAASTCCILHLRLLQQGSIARKAVAALVVMMLRLPVTYHRSSVGNVVRDSKALSMTVKAARSCKRPMLACCSKHMLQTRSAVLSLITDTQHPDNPPDQPHLMRLLYTRRTGSSGSAACRRAS
jgi:hypothetical protein